MKEQLIAKIEQNPEMLNKVLTTGDELLIEATWDKIWPSATTFFSKEINMGIWSGKNLLDILLVKCYTCMTTHEARDA